MHTAGPDIGRVARARTWLGVLAAAALLGCGGGGGMGLSLPQTPTLTPGSVDLTVDADVLAASLVLVDRTFAASDCAVREGAIVAAGTRRLLLFETRAINLGELDVIIGSPTNPIPPLVLEDFEYHDCHGHYHMEGWAEYELLQDGIPVALGTKQGFCLLDNVRAHPLAAQTATYHCGFQGLSSGYGDIYTRNVQGQWIDVTGVPAGAYVLRVTINATQRIVEVNDVHPNTIEVALNLPGPFAYVPPFDDDHGNTIATATLVAFPIGLMSAIERSGDLDFFEVRVVAGERYEFALELDTLADSALRVLTASGATLASNDNEAPGQLGSRLTLTAPFTGPLFLEARGVLGATGTYRFSAGFAP